MFLKHRFGLTHSSLILANAVPLFGVVILGWDPVIVFMIYVFESIIIGLFNIAKMLVAYVYDISSEGEGVKKPLGKTELLSDQYGIQGLAIIPFFGFHYFFFIFVQSIFLFAIIGIDQPMFGHPFRIIHNYKIFLQGEGNWALIGLTASHGISFLIDYLYGEQFKEESVSSLSMQPYKRIYVQQFMVILGVFLMVFLKAFHSELATYAFILLFIILKTFFDLHYHDILDHSKKKFNFLYRKKPVNKEDQVLKS